MKGKQSPLHHSLDPNQTTITLLSLFGGSRREAQLLCVKNGTFLLSRVLFLFHWVETLGMLPSPWSNEGGKGQPNQSWWSVRWQNSSHRTSKRSSLSPILSSLLTNTFPKCIYNYIILNVEGTRSPAQCQVTCSVEYWIHQQHSYKHRDIRLYLTLSPSRPELSD